jgi:hypothetical protein
MVLIGIGKDIAQRFVLRAIANVVGMIKFVVRNHLKN